MLLSDAYSTSHVFIGYVTCVYDSSNLRIIVSNSFSSMSPSELQSILQQSFMIVLRRCQITSLPGNIVIFYPSIVNSWKSDSETKILGLKSCIIRFISSDEITVLNPMLL
jgi:hypothetical protein